MRVPLLVLPLLSLALMGFYTADRRVIDDGDCGVPSGAFRCTIAGQTKPLVLIEKAEGDGSSCVYVDPSDNSEARFKRMHGNLFLVQTSSPKPKSPIEYAFMEADANDGWSLYLQDPKKAKALEKRLAQSIADNAERIKKVIEEEGDIQVVPDKTSGTEKLVGPKELILIVLNAHHKTVLQKVGTCKPRS